MRGRLIAAILTAVAVTAASGWLLSASSSGDGATGDYQPRPLQDHRLTGPDADSRRDRLVRLASPRLASDEQPALQPPPTLPAGHPLARELPTCRFIAAPASGTSAKFECALDGGEVVKVKYGRNPEVHAEAAATRLLTLLGYAADHVFLVRRLRCFGCPRFPFFTMKLLTLASATGLLIPYGYDSGYTDFEWVAVERRFPAPAVETAGRSGWAWWELKDSEAPRPELDALRLLAVFLAHWDNKAENQRVVCGPGSGTRDPGSAVDGECRRPVLMLQDVGATFGPPKVNLARWRDLPVWADPETCLVSMSSLPSHGATFPDAHISEQGRLLLARRLALLTDADVRTTFAEARFGAFHAGTDDRRDLAAWTSAFRNRVRQIATAGPCPDPGSRIPGPGPAAPELHSPGT